MAQDSCIVEKVEASDSPVSPILINFDYGHHPDKETADLPCDMYMDPNNYLKRNLVVHRNGQQFIGKLAPEEETLSQSLLLVRNRKTNKARLVFTQSCKLMNISKEEETSRKRKKIERSKTLPALSPSEKISAINFLTQRFGSKKSKRASELGLRNTINLSGKESEIKETVSNVDVKINEINTENDGNEELLKLIPACNREAKFVSDLYDVDNIINSVERETLKPQAEFLINNGLTDKDEKTSFFMFSHYTLLDDKPDIEKVVLLLYANTLFKFYNLSAGDLKKKNLLTLIHPTSRPVAMRVLNDFTVLTKSGRSRPTFYKDKLVCYIMVLILLFADFKINLDTLSSCLKGFGYKKLLQLARVVGLVPLGSFTSAKTFVLKIPLPPLPRPRMPKKRMSTAF
ncbi:unnamed protein product [Nezara viridula]|uniref:DNA-directed RNA polymerase I subunit RPA49 n=1 Tax=Nezara viridula TaxID=85310 RepID=A0A9P0MWG0_NEZVI|nr:unnamed protein product [Nezara viridula]